MRITKEGRQEAGYTGKWHCPHCGCQWELDSSDKTPKYMSDQRDGDCFHMPCPTCKSEVYRAVNRGYRGPG